MTEAIDYNKKLLQSLNYFGRLLERATENGQISCPFQNLVQFNPTEQLMTIAKLELKEGRRLKHTSVNNNTKPFIVVINSTFDDKIQDSQGYPSLDSYVNFFVNTFKWASDEIESVTNLCKKCLQARTTTISILVQKSNISRNDDETKKEYHLIAGINIYYDLRCGTIINYLCVARPSNEIGLSSIYFVNPNHQSQALELWQGHRFWDFHQSGIGKFLLTLAQLMHFGSKQLQAENAIQYIDSLFASEQHNTAVTWNIILQALWTENEAGQYYIHLGFKLHNKLQQRGHSNCQTQADDIAIQEETDAVIYYIDDPHISLFQKDELLFVDLLPPNVDKKTLLPHYMTWYEQHFFDRHSVLISNPMNQNIDLNRLFTAFKDQKGTMLSQELLTEIQDTENQETNNIGATKMLKALYGPKKSSEGSFRNYELSILHQLKYWYSVILPKLQPELQTNFYSSLQNELTDIASQQKLKLFGLSSFRSKIAEQIDDLSIKFKDVILHLSGRPMGKQTPFNLLWIDYQVLSLFTAVPTVNVIWKFHLLRVIEATDSTIKIEYMPTKPLFKILPSEKQEVNILLCRSKMGVLIPITKFEDICLPHHATQDELDAADSLNNLNPSLQMKFPVWCDKVQELEKSFENPLETPILIDCKNFVGCPILEFDTFYGDDYDVSSTVPALLDDFRHMTTDRYNFCKSFPTVMDVWYTCDNRPMYSTAKMAYIVEIGCRVATQIQDKENKLTAESEDEFDLTRDIKNLKLLQLIIEIKTAHCIAENPQYVVSIFNPPFDISTQAVCQFDPTIFKNQELWKTANQVQRYFRKIFIKHHDTFLPAANEFINNPTSLFEKIKEANEYGKMYYGLPDYSKLTPFHTVYFCMIDEQANIDHCRIAIESVFGVPAWESYYKFRKVFIQDPVNITILEDSLKMALEPEFDHPDTWHLLLYIRMLKVFEANPLLAANELNVKYIKQGPNEKPQKLEPGITMVSIVPEYRTPKIAFYLAHQEFFNGYYRIGLSNYQHYEKQQDQFEMFVKQVKDPDSRTATVKQIIESDSKRKRNAVLESNLHDDIRKFLNKLYRRPITSHKAAALLKEEIERMHIVRKQQKDVIPKSMQTEIPEYLHYVFNQMLLDSLMLKCLKTNRIQLAEMAKYEGIDASTGKSTTKYFDIRSKISKDSMKPMHHWLKRCYKDFSTDLKQYLEAPDKYAMDSDKDSVSEDDNDEPKTRKRDRSVHRKPGESIEDAMARRFNPLYMYDTDKNPKGETYSNYPFCTYDRDEDYVIKPEDLQRPKMFGAAMETATHIYTPFELQNKFDTLLDQKPKKQPFKYIFEAAIDLFEGMQLDRRLSISVVPTEGVPNCSLNDCVHLACLLDPARDFDIDPDYHNRSLVHVRCDSYALKQDINEQQLKAMKKPSSAKVQLKINRKFLLNYMSYFDADVSKSIEKFIDGERVQSIKQRLSEHPSAAVLEQLAVPDQQRDLAWLPKCHKKVTTYEGYSYKTPRGKNASIDVPNIDDDSEDLTDEENDTSKKRKRPAARRNKNSKVPREVVPYYSNNATYTRQHGIPVLDYHVNTAIKKRNEVKRSSTNPETWPLPVSRKPGSRPMKPELFQIRALRAVCSVDKKTKEKTWFWSGLQGAFIVQLDEAFVKQNFDKSVRVAAQNTHLELLEHKQNDRSNFRWIRVPAGATRDDDPPKSLHHSDGDNFYYQGTDDQCLIGGLINAWANKEETLEFAKHAFQIIHESNSLYNVNRYDEFNKIVMRVVGNQKRMKREKHYNPFNGDNDKHPVVVILKGQDLSENHSITFFDNKIFDSASRKILKKSQETLDWCCGEAGFAGFARAWRIVPFKTINKAISRPKDDLLSIAEFDSDDDDKPEINKRKQQKKSRKQKQQRNRLRNLKSRAHQQAKKEEEKRKQQTTEEAKSDSETETEDDS